MSDIFASHNDEQLEAHSEYRKGQINEFAQSLLEHERLKIEAVQEAVKLLEKHEVKFQLFAEAGGQLIDVNKITYRPTHDGGLTDGMDFLDASTKTHMMIFTKCFGGKAFVCLDENGRPEYDIIDGEVVAHQEDDEY